MPAASKSIGWVRSSDHGATWSRGYQALTLVNSPGLIDAGRGKSETDKFIDHFRSASGANARKVDWPAAWRNWMRRADDELINVPARAGPPRPVPQSGSDRARDQAAALKAKLAQKGAL